MNVEDLYQDIILDHYRAKHHAGLRSPYGGEVHHVNPSCGDEITLRVQLGDDGQTITDVSYQAEGCSISQASTSVMTDLVIGHSITEAMELHHQFRELMDSRGKAIPDEETFGDAVAFLGVAQFPNRIKCALLGWSAMTAATAEALIQAGDAERANQITEEDE